MPVDADEVVAWSGRANRSVGVRAVGGTLYLTDRRLLFRPHLVERWFFGGQEWGVPRSRLAGFGVESRSRDAQGLFSGGLRKRLRVNLTDRGPELFVVPSPERAAVRLSEELG